MTANVRAHENVLCGESAITIRFATVKLMDFFELLLFHFLRKQISRFEKINMPWHKTC